MKVKTYLEKGETKEEAEDKLLKALKDKTDHFEEFPDRTMEKTSDSMKREYRKLFKDMMKEIKEALETQHNLNEKL